MGIFLYISYKVITLSCYLIVSNNFVMKRLLTILLFLKVTSNFLIAQTNEIFEEKNVKGVIFSKDYINKAHNWLDNSYRFTPTREEIKAFEKNLKLDLKRINTNRWNQKGSCPIIHKNLKKYVRQYLGFIDDSGKKYLLINFLWQDNVEENENDEFYNELGDWKKHWQVWFDGCSHFWNVKYYIDSELIFDLQINGSS